MKKMKIFGIIFLICLAHPEREAAIVSANKPVMTGSATADPEYGLEPETAAATLPPAPENNKTRRDLLEDGVEGILNQWRNEVTKTFMHDLTWSKTPGLEELSVVVVAVCCVFESSFRVIVCTVRVGKNCNNNFRLL